MKLKTIIKQLEILALEINEIESGHDEVLEAYEDVRQAISVLKSL